MSLTKEKRHELEEAFIMNQGPDKRLECSKLGIIARSIGRCPTEADLIKLKKDLSSRGQNSLDLGQVEQIINSYNWAPETEETLFEALSTFDRDGNGFFSVTEVRSVLTHMGEKLTDEEVDEMMREADLTGDGMVNCQALAKTLCEFNDKS